MRYPVFRRSRYKSSNDMSRQPLVDPKQYPKHLALFSKSVWHRITHSSTIGNIDEQNTNIDTIETINIHKNKVNDKDNEDNNNNKTEALRLITCRNNYYYPLIATKDELVSIIHPEKEVVGSEVGKSDHSILSQKTTSTTSSSIFDITSNKFNELEYLDAIIQENRNHQVEITTKISNNSSKTGH